MMSTTTTTLKTGRKAIPTLTIMSATTSPMSQRTIEETLPMEKQASILNTNIQSILLTLKESTMKLQKIMMKNQNEMRADINELKEEMRKLKAEMKADISKVEDKVGIIQQALEKNEATIKEVREKDRMN
uniref:Uncharacterized protein n=1 Tax=Micrurus spixii TaxID=129469 RepID=A0A2D4LM90_9SAUR